MLGHCCTRFGLSAINPLTRVKNLKIKDFCIRKLPHKSNCGGSIVMKLWQSDFFTKILKRSRFEVTSIKNMGTSHTNFATLTQKCAHLYGNVFSKDNSDLSRWIRNNIFFFQFYYCDPEHKWWNKVWNNIWYVEKKIYLNSKERFFNCLNFRHFQSSFYEHNKERITKR